MKPKNIGLKTNEYKITIEGGITLFGELTSPDFIGTPSTQAFLVGREQ
jgi:hypothetical protein